MPEELKQNVKKSKKYIWLILILLLLLLIAAIIYLILTYQGKINPIENTNEVSDTGTIEPVQPGDFNKPDGGVVSDLVALNGGEDTDQEEISNLLFIASSFAERFGSYSSQSEYQNLDDLESFMTVDMNSWVTGQYKGDLEKAHPEFGDYYGIVTKAISANMESKNDQFDQAVVMVKTQRQEFVGDLNTPNVFYQNIKLELIKSADQWKVDGAYWQ